MSKEVALKNINLEPCDRWAHTQYSLGYHLPYLERMARVERTDPRFEVAWRDAFSIDFNWSINDGLIDWAKSGRITDLGHASYAADGTDQRASQECPFNSPEEVWSFDAIAEYGLPDEREQIASYDERVQNARTGMPGQLTTGGTYKTIVSGAIQSFGWDMLLMGASDPAKMENVFDNFFRRSMFLHKCWAQTSVEVILTHDDFVWSSGAFMHPNIYRKVIIPRYAELWKIAHAAGKKVFFCADGNFTEFAGDIVNAGADGLVFEPMNDFDFMVDNFGRSTCLVGSFVDCRDLTFDNWEKVQADINRTFERLNDCRGAIVAVGNHLPSNIPDDMLQRYFDELLPRLASRTTDKKS